MRTPKLIFMIGIPGSGKTSWLRKQLLSDKVIEHILIVSPDKIRKELYEDISCQDNNAEVWAIAKNRTKEYLSKGISVILDATNVNSTYRSLFLEGLPPCILQAKIFRANPEDCWERIQNDLKKGVDRANVPKEVIDRMYTDFTQTTQIIDLEGFKLIDDL